MFGLVPGRLKSGVGGGECRDFGVGDLFRKGEIDGGADVVGLEERSLRALVGIVAIVSQRCELGKLVCATEESEVVEDGDDGPLLVEGEKHDGRLVGARHRTEACHEGGGVLCDVRPIFDELADVVGAEGVVALVPADDGAVEGVV